MNEITTKGQAIGYLIDRRLEWDDFNQITPYDIDLMSEAAFLAMSKVQYKDKSAPIPPSLLVQFYQINIISKLKQALNEGDKTE